MKIAILKERRPHETRVAATPETVKKLKALGAEVTIEAGAGEAASYIDQAYVDAGATVAPDAAAAAAAGEILFKIQRPMTASEASEVGGADEMALLRQGQVLMSPLGALTNKDLVQQLAARGVTAFALELIPRITRAQSMDILSSQANLAGYKAVIDAAFHFTRAFPMMLDVLAKADSPLFIMPERFGGRRIFYSRLRWPGRSNPQRLCALRGHWTPTKHHGRGSSARSACFFSFTGRLVFI